MVSALLPIIYLAFISLGLPDTLLGAAWPSMYQELGVPVSWSGVIFMTISGSTAFSSLMSDWSTRKFGVGRVTLFSVVLTAAALFGFSISRSFWALCLFAVPYGLGAGNVDAALNNYVALHYASRHMNWLHCMWGIGTTIGPYIMSRMLFLGQGWGAGYRCIGLFQVVLAGVLACSLPLWKKQRSALGKDRAAFRPEGASGMRATLRLPGVIPAMGCFFCYDAVEQTVNLWTSSYLVDGRGIGEVKAAGFAGLFFLGLTVGRAVSGVISAALDDRKMVILGQGIVFLGILCLLLPAGDGMIYAGLVVMGAGCAPIYPGLMHAAPAYFGQAHSQAVIGLQTASACLGMSLMPPLFGWIAGKLRIGIFPWALLLFLLLMICCHHALIKACRG